MTSNNTLISNNRSAHSQQDFGKRKVARHQLYIDPLVLDSDGKIMARVVDISEKGALLYIKHDQDVQVGQEISGWLDSPSLSDDVEIFLAINMNIRWLEQEPGKKWLKAGCEFLFKSDEEEELMRLKYLIAERSRQSYA